MENIYIRTQPQDIIFLTVTNLRISFFNYFININFRFYSKISDMKTILLYVLIIITMFAPERVMSQWTCGTPDTSANNSLNPFISSRSNFEPTTFDDVTLRVYYHVIRRSDQSGGYTYTEVLESFNILQIDFIKYGIYFAWDCNINYIDSDDYFEEANKTIFDEVNNYDGIDIFLFPDSNSKNGGLANGYGHESQFYVTGETEFLGMALTQVVSHEMGHVFFLYHTFRGCESGGTWELTDSSNCEVAGDYVCDTPADPHIFFNVDRPSCEWNGEVHPICKNTAPEPIEDYTPDPTNIMAYTWPSCMDTFTLGQAQRMRNFLDTAEFLQPCIVSEPFVYENYNCIPAPVFSSIVQNTCLELISDLQDFHQYLYIPIGLQLVFGNEIDPESPTFSQVDPILSGSGTYYGFYYNPSTDNYGPPSDPIIISTCCGFDNDIILTDSVVYNECPELIIDLNNYYTGTPPEGATLIWSTSPDPHSEPFPIFDSNNYLIENTTFYAYYYNEEVGCYSNPSTGLEIIIESCCGGIGTEDVYITGIVNYSSPLSIGGNIYIEDQGILTISQFMEFSDDKGIFVKEGGKLIVEGFAVLTVCNLSTDIWNGIHLEPGSKLKTRGGKILNVKNGIVTQSSSGNFNRPIIDLKGIEIHGKSLPNSKGISLYNPLTLNLSEIKVQGFHTGLSIWGGNGDGYLHKIYNSEFKNLHYAGIVSAFNSFLIFDCTFENSIIGVYAYEINGGNIYQGEFKDIYTGLFSVASYHVSLHNSKMNLEHINESRGVIGIQSPTFEVLNSQIAANRFGISLFNSPTSFISNNFISKEDINSPSPIGGAISLVNSSHSVVFDNNINTENAIYGIEANNTHSSLLFKNNILSHRGQSAINLHGSMGTKTISNSLMASQFCHYGIDFSNSAGNEIRCNTIEDCIFGLYVRHNSEYQNILGNVLDNTEDLTIRSEIGIQPFHGNLFIGGKTAAFGLNPDQIRDSRFYVNSEYAYHMPSNPEPGNDEWFSDDVDEPAFYVCPDSTNIPEDETPFNNDSLDLCQYYHHLKGLDTLKPNKFFLGVFDLLFLSESRQDFSLPACILSDSDFQNLCGMQELAGVALDLDKLGQHELTTDSLVSYQHQLVGSSDSTVQAQLISLIAGELDSLSDDFQSAREQDSILLDSIYSDLNAISCSSTLVNTWKGIYQKYLSFLHVGKVDSADYNTLRQYSSLCSDIYGKPIHLARAVTATFDTTYYAQYDDCLQGMEQRVIREQTVETNIKVWPNPTSSIVQIELPENYSGEMIITDLWGRKLGNYQIENGSLDFVEMPDKNGMYLLNFFSVDGQYEQHKIIVTR